MDRDQENQHLPAPVIGSRCLRFAAVIFSKSFYLLLTLNCIAIIGGINLQPYVSTKLVLMMVLLLVTSMIARTNKASWTHLFVPATTDTNLFVSSNERLNSDVREMYNGAYVIASLKAFLKNRDLFLAGASLICAYVISKFLQLCVGISQAGTFADAIFLAIFFSALFPLAAAAGMQSQRKFQKFKLFRFPNFAYSSCHAGFISFVFLLSYMPNGVGNELSYWLNFCMLDANMTDSNVPEASMQLVVSTILFVALMTSFRHAIVRFSAGYQFFLKRAIVFEDSLLDAFRATVRVNPIKINLPDRHPHLHNACSTALYILLIYAVIFAGVAFCPGPLGDTIFNWLQACLLDANIDLDLGDNFGLLIFIASVIAAYVTIPVAVMSCSLLSTKKMKYILASSEGILTPCHLKTLIGYSPIMSWKNLSRISLEKVNDTEKQYLRFSFDRATPVKLRISETEKESLVALLNTADEFSKKCLIEKPVMELRRHLIDATKSHTMADTKRFSSTVFSLLKTGDELKGNYRIIRKLAGKSLSAVYLARNASNALVVIKEFVLPTNIEDCERLDAAFEREYELLKKLEHPGIAKVIETFEERTAKYLVVEHIAGNDLRELVNESGRRSETSVKAWALSIASIMKHLHEQEPAVLHRDLTPDNLMIDDEGVLKLIDFGASHQFIEGVTGTLIGKQCYIAPEQLRGKPSIESDIYSFGCTLYFLLTGQDPKALQQSDLLLSDISVNSTLRQLIFTCTEFEPENRFHSFSEVISMLHTPSLDFVEFELIDGTPTLKVETSYGL